MNNTKKVTLIALVLAALGSFFTWASVQSIFGTISISGTSGDGKFTFLFAAIAAWLGFYKTPKRKHLIWAAIVCVVGFSICVGNMSNIAGSSDEEFAVVQIGWGLWMCIAAFTIAFFGFCAMIAQQSHEKLHDDVFRTSQPTNW